MNIIIKISIVILKIFIVIAIIYLGLWLLGHITKKVNPDYYERERPKTK